MRRHQRRQQWRSYLLRRQYCYQFLLQQLNHRGPDGQGTWTGGPDDRLGLAHSRLSIIDLAGGHQPMGNEDGAIQVVFNGEIFNHLELRAELQAQGHTFRTHSDTEVIVHLYEQVGEAFVDHLNGQFAIALWDGRLRRLVLARDRTGIRPLFFAWTSQGLAFASEVKALMALSDMPRALDVGALGETFTYWAPLPGRTVFQGIDALRPGHLMVIDALSQDMRGSVRSHRYWDWDFSAGDVQGHRSGADLAEELRELLIDAVRLQLRADVPVGAYLSGGLDSSIVTTLIRHFTDTPLRTFSLTFDDAEFDESAQQ